MWTKRRWGRVQRLSCLGATMALPHPGGRQCRREEPMRAANQRPTLALGPAILLVGLAGCTAAGRHTVANQTRQTDRTAAGYVVPGEREYPADFGPAAPRG